MSIKEKSFSISLQEGSLSADVIAQIEDFLRKQRSDESAYVVTIRPVKNSSRSRFIGTVNDYLKIVKENTHVYRTAAESIYRAISSHGYVEYSEMFKDRAEVLQRLKLPAYRAFEAYFYDLEDVIDEFMTSLCGSANPGDLSRKAMLILGPGGAGKSVFIEHIANLLSAYTSEPICHIDGCPRHCEPLLAIPYLERSGYETSLKVKIDGYICSDCKKRLDNEYDSFLDLPVSCSNFDMSFGVGYGHISVSDLANNAQDGVDPLFAYDGPIPSSNRGLFLIDELTLFKPDQLNRVGINNMTERKVSSPHKKGVDSIDNVILATGRDDSKAVLEADAGCSDRIKVLKIHLCLSLWGELSIYAKMLKDADLPVHMHSDMWKAVAVASLYTRYKDDSSFLTHKLKLEIYTGIKPTFEKSLTSGTLSIDRGFLRKKYPEDGMIGINPRFSTEAIRDAAATTFQSNPLNITKYYQERNSQNAKITRFGCVNFYHALSTMYDAIEKHPQYKLNAEQYRKMIDYAHEYMLDKLKDDLNKFLTCGFEDKVEQLVVRYISNASLYINNLMSVFESFCYKERRDEKLEQFFGEVINYRIEYRKALIKHSASTSALVSLQGDALKTAKLFYTDFDPLSEDEHIEVDFLEDIEMSASTDKFNKDTWKAMYNLRKKVAYKIVGALRKGVELKKEDIPFLVSLVRRYVKQVYNLYSVDEIIKDVEFDEIDGKIMPKNRVYNDGEVAKFKELISWMLNEEIYCKKCALFTLNHLGNRLKTGNKKLK